LVAWECVCECEWNSPPEMAARRSVVTSVERQAMLRLHREGWKKPPSPKGTSPKSEPSRLFFLGEPYHLLSAWVFRCVSIILFWPWLGLGQVRSLAKDRAPGSEGGRPGSKARPENGVDAEERRFLPGTPAPAAAEVRWPVGGVRTHAHTHGEKLTGRRTGGLCSLLSNVPCV